MTDDGAKRDVAMTSVYDTAKAASLKMLRRQREVDDEDMSAEDKQEREELQRLVERVAGLSTETSALSEADVLKALEGISAQLRTATSSMTSVPKPLKFLRPNFDALEGRFVRMSNSHNKKYLADILSVLATTVAHGKIVPDTPPKEIVKSSEENKPKEAVATKYEKKQVKIEYINFDEAMSAEDMSLQGVEPKKRHHRLCLYYRLLGGATTLTSWGQEFLRNLSGEISAEYAAVVRQEENSEKMQNVDEDQKNDDGEDDAKLTAIIATRQQLQDLVSDIVPFYITRSAEIDAIDLLAEVGRIEDILPHVNSNNYRRLIPYLIALAAQAPQDDQQTMLNVAFDILTREKEVAHALRVAMKLGSKEKMLAVFKLVEDKASAHQLAILCCRQRIVVDWSEIVESCPAFAQQTDGDATMDSDEEVKGPLERLQLLAGGDWLSSHFLQLAEELDVIAPKLPEDIYKVHLEDRRGEAMSIDSAKQNLAATFVNAFVNAGFCNDNLMSPEDSRWLHKNKDHGMLSAAASLGVINLWNMNEGLAKVDKLQWSADPNIKAGAYVAFGLFNATVRSEWDPAFVLLGDPAESEVMSERLGAVLGLGLAYAATGRSEISDILIPIVIDMTHDIELSSIAALSLGLCFASTSNDAVVEVLIQALIDRSAAIPEVSDTTAAADSSYARFLTHFSVAIALVFLGQKETCETSLMALEAVPKPLSTYTATAVEGFAYAASGDVSRMQAALERCLEQGEADDTADSAAPVVTPQTATATGGTDVVGVPFGALPDANNSSATTTSATTTSATTTSANNTSANTTVGGSAPATTTVSMADVDITSEPTTAAATVANLPSPDLDKAAAVLSLPLITLCDPTGGEMMLRLLEHLLQYSQLPIRRAVPLALAMHAVSNPKPTVVESLSKLSHDQDADVALHAIFGLGLVGAGTNNSRIASLLRQLAAYYYKDANALFTVRIAQGLLYMGKGLLSLNPVHSDSFLVDFGGLGCLLVVLHVCLNMRKSILARHHFLLYFLVPAIFPRMLLTLDENLKPLPVTVRVGQAVDVVGLAGQPRTITGFQTHTTPVLLAAGERAELDTEDYEACSSVLEGVVVLKKKEVVEGDENTSAS